LFVTFLGSNLVGSVVLLSDLKISQFSGGWAEKFRSRNSSYICYLDWFSWSLPYTSIYVLTLVTSLN